MGREGGGRENRAGAGVRVAAGCARKSNNPNKVDLLYYLECGIFLASLRWDVCDCQWQRLSCQPFQIRSLGKTAWCEVADEIVV